MYDEQPVFNDYEGEQYLYRDLKTVSRDGPDSPIRCLAIRGQLYKM